MEEVFVMTTQLDNKTDWVIELEYVYYKRLCPRILPPGKSRSVQLSRIIKRCRKHGANWAIRVLINNEFTGIYITPGNLLYHTRLVFEYKSRVVDNDAALFDLCVVGIPEKAIDYLLRVEGIGGLFRRNNIWKKRACARIAVADPKFAIDLRHKELEDLYLVTPLLRDGFSTLENRTTEAIDQHVASTPLAINDTNLPQGQSVSSGGDGDMINIIPFVPFTSEEEERRRDVISTEHSNGTVGRVMKAIRRCTSPSPYNHPGSTTAVLRVPVKKDRGLSFGVQKARVKQILLQKRLVLYRSRMHKFHHNIMKINMHLLFFVLALGLVIGFTRLRVVLHFISFGGINSDVFTILFN